MQMSATVNSVASNTSARLVLAAIDRLVGECSTYLLHVDARPLFKSCRSILLKTHLSIISPHFNGWQERDHSTHSPI
eukprot:m.360505 g.360505  ORF g.360505 m.360505 type:complete len:77 (+) comp19071_c0_seq1:1664-1894(+)